MSGVEAMVVSALAEEGSPRKAFQAGITENDFELCDEEFRWIVRRAESKKPVNPRLLKKHFPEFEFTPQRESTTDLIEELRQEKAFITVNSSIEEALTEMDNENALQTAQVLRERLGETLKAHSTASDVLIKQDWQGHLKYIKQLQIMRENGEVAGIPTGIPHLDHHWGGLQNASSYVWLGRPGDAKSFCLAKLAVEGMLDGRRVGFFSPEMTEHQHRCRFNTLLSANPEIQKALGLKGAFRNRALKDGHGFNLKSYKKFLKYVEEVIKGEIALFTQKYRREKMTPGYIESRVEDLGIELLIVDPIYKLKSPRRRMAKHEEIGDIVDALQDIATGFNIPVVMSNQANRALVGIRQDAPDKGSSYGSDAPAQEADCVIGVKHYSTDHIMKLNCSKNRHGEEFKFVMSFHPNVGKMVDVTPLKGDYTNGYDAEAAEELRKALREQERMEE